MGKNRAPRHHYAAAKLKRDWENAAGWAIRRRTHKPTWTQTDTPPRICVEVRLYLKNARQADPHNYTSYEVAWLIDGLVKHGILHNDRATDIHVHDPQLIPPDTNDQPTIRLNPYEQEHHTCPH